MNYQKVYNQIIDRAKTRKIVGYKEKHHIIPKCIGGNNEKNNLVNLTAREHFICHWLLHNIHPDNIKLFLAFDMMCKVKDKNQERYIPSSRVIEYAKKEHSKRISGDNNPKYWLNKSRPQLKGKALSKNTRKKISESLQGHEVSEETRNKIRKSNTGQKAWNKGLKTGPLSKKHRQKISKSNMGKIMPKVKDETKEKIRKFQLENSSSAKKIMQKDKMNNIIAVFKNVSEARKQTGVSRIFDSLKGRREFVSGYKWEYCE